MNYTKENKSKEFADALSLKSSQVAKLKHAISMAYDQSWHRDGPNVDQINAFLAPYINTPEEAYYTATVVMTDVMGAMMYTQLAPKK